MSTTLSTVYEDPSAVPLLPLHVFNQVIKRVRDTGRPLALKHRGKIFGVKAVRQDAAAAMDDDWTQVEGKQPSSSSRAYSIYFVDKYMPGAA